MSNSSRYKSHNEGGVDKIELLYRIGEVLPVRMTGIAGDSAEVVGLVVGANHSGDGPPTYNFAFLSRWKDGSTSGLIEIKDFCLWRYAVDRDLTLEEMVAINRIEDLNPNQLFGRYDDGQYFRIVDELVRQGVLAKAQEAQTLPAATDAPLVDALLGKDGE